MEEFKSLAFLLDCPLPGKMMLFPDYYEVLKEEIHELYQEVDKSEMLKSRWDASLVNSNYKVFKLK